MKNSFLLLITLFVVACQHSANDVNVQLTNTHPSLPQISYKTNLGLSVFEYDIPRDLNAAMVIKNTTKCRSVPKEEQDEYFWSECGEYPVVYETNVYRCFNYDNWNIYLSNMNILQEEIKLLRSKIDEVNKQRAEWQALNQSNENNK